MLDLLEHLEIFFWSSLTGIFIAILCAHSPFKQKGKSGIIQSLDAIFKSPFWHYGSVPLLFLKCHHVSGDGEKSNT